jgi:hypothetical protein
MDRMGSWWIRSGKDPRWNLEGRGSFNIFSAEELMLDLIEKMKKTLGDLPDDLEIGFIKD